MECLGSYISSPKGLWPSCPPPLWSAGQGKTTDFRAFSQKLCRRAKVRASCCSCTSCSRSFRSGGLNKDPLGRDSKQQAGGETHETSAVPKISVRESVELTMTDPKQFHVCSAIEHVTEPWLGVYCLTLASSETRDLGGFERPKILPSRPQWLM